MTPLMFDGASHEMDAPSADLLILIPDGAPGNPKTKIILLVDSKSSSLAEGPAYRGGQCLITTDYQMI